MRTSKNCTLSTIVNQLRFRDCENIKTFTLCTTDPAVESSFNIYFAPYNAFFPHLKELFIKGKFNPSMSNHIDTPYDFTPDKVMADGAPHYLLLPEEEFKVEEISDGDAPIEEMYDGYSQSESLVQSKVGDKYANATSNEQGPSGGFDFVNNDNQNNMGFQINNDNNNQFMSMDNNNNNIMEINDNNQFVPVNNNNMMDFNTGSNQGGFMGFDNNVNTNMNNMNNVGGVFDYSSNVPLSSPIEQVDEEELQRRELRKQEEEERTRKIRERMEKELQMKNKAREEAAEWMNKFNEERMEKISKNKKNNAYNEEKAKKEKEELNSLQGENINHWEGVSSKIALKEGDYKGTNDVSRMRQCIINRKNDVKK